MFSRTLHIKTVKLLQIWIAYNENEEINEIDLRQRNNGETNLPKDAVLLDVTIE